jgi:hypothetical protein
VKFFWEKFDPEKYFWEIFFEKIPAKKMISTKKIASLNFDRNRLIDRSFLITNTGHEPGHFSQMKYSHALGMKGRVVQQAGLLTDGDYRVETGGTNDEWRLRLKNGFKIKRLLQFIFQLSQF